MLDKSRELYRKQRTYYNYYANHSNDGSKGLHYVIGDLHGKLGTYLDAVSLLGNNDILYILGDVIDRGKNGISILQDIMKRNNVQLVLGNHEWEFIKCYEIIKKYDLTVEEVLAYARMDNFVKGYDSGRLSENTYENGLGMVKAQLEANGYEMKDISKEELSFMGLWMTNSGNKTLKSFIELSDEEQENIINFLKEQPVIVYKEINGRKVCLVHAAPYDEDWFLELIPDNRKEEVITYATLMELDSKSQFHFMQMCTERRQKHFKKGEQTPFDKMKDLGYETIFGHTPQIVKATRSKKDSSLCLDISAHDGAAVYCVEAALVQYIDKSSEEQTGKVSEPEEPLLLEDRSIDLLDGYVRYSTFENIIEAQFGPQKQDQSSQSSGPENR